MPGNCVTGWWTRSRVGPPGLRLKTGSGLKDFPRHYGGKKTGLSAHRRAVLVALAEITQAHQHGI